MVRKFFSFTASKQIVYILIAELLIMSGIALFANSNDVFGKNLVQLIYDPVYLLFPEKVSYFLKPCLGLGCIFPSMTNLGLLYLFGIGILLPLFAAYVFRLMLEFIAKRKGII
jgi:hypothetical protein